MTWEQRLREMVLAGGAVATAACGSASTNSSFPRSDAGEATDATTGDAISDGFVVQCCNANPDPCCTCEADASPTAQCAQELACKEAGTWDARAYTCEPSADAGDSGGGDAPVDAPGDAGTEGDAHD